MPRATALALPSEGYATGGQCSFKVSDDLREAHRKRIPPPHQHMVAAWLGKCLAMETDRFSQPAANAVALDGIAHFLGDRKAETRAVRRCLGITMLEKLQQKTAPGDFPSPGGGQKFCAFLQASHKPSKKRRRRNPDAAAPPVGHRDRGCRSGRKALATARAATGNNGTTTIGGHAGTETVTALAHQLGGLVSPLHLGLTAGTGGSFN